MSETEKLRVVADLTVQLTKLRQEQCKHLCIENFAPALFASLFEAVDCMNQSTLTPAEN